MATKLKSAALRYGLPLTTFALIILAAFAVRHFFSFSLDPTPLLIIVLIASAWYGGRGPGLLVLLEYEIAIQYFTPTQSLTLKSILLIVNRLILFLSLVLFVSSRRSAQKRLQEQSERLQVSLASIGDAVIATDLNGLVNFMNPTAETLTGWTIDQAINKPLTDVFHIINEFTRQLVEDPVAKVLHEGRVVELANHTLLLSRDGREFPIDDSGAPIRGADGEIIGVILVFRDMRERKQAEATRIALAAIVESSDDAIISKSLEGTIRSWNKGAERLYGYSAEEALGRSISMLIPPQRMDDFPAIMGKLKRGESIKYDETKRLTKDGKIIDVSLAISPLKDHAGNVIGASTIARDISERKQAEKILQTAQEQLQLVTDTMAVAVARCSRDMRYTWVSQGYTKWAQRPFAEINGRYIPDVIGMEAFETILPYIEKVLTGERVEYESLVNMAGRGLRWINAIYTPTYDSTNTPDGWVAVIVDTTAQKALEDAVRTSEERFRLAAEAVHGIIYDVDYKTQRVERTRGLFEVIGYHPQEVPSTNEWWIKQMHPDDRPRILKDYRQLLDSDVLEFQYEYRLRHKDGRWIHLMDRSVVTRDENGRVLRQVGCSLDITQIREAEQALKDADRRKDEFLAMLAHELRNPLAPIHNAVQLMRRFTSVDPEVKRMREVIERQTELLIRLVDDLLDVSRITQGRISLRKEPVDLSAIVSRAVETSRPLIDARKHQLTITLPPDPVQVEGDLIRLSQVFSNLLNNAAKYTENGGDIRLTAEAVGNEIIVRVKDNGMGIAIEDLRQVFGLFAQVDRSLDRTQGGLGIGLTVVHSLVEMHGGRVEAFSEGTGKGSEFVIHLPMITKPATDEKVTLKKIVKETSQMQPASYYRVLVVDDNADSAEGMAILLQFAGHQVQMAFDGLSALGVARSFLPQVVLLDIGLPKLNGYEVANQLRKEPEFEKAVLIAVTGYGQAEDRQLSKVAGFDHHLTKPVDYELLSSLIHSLIAEKITN
jgi:PAS domain S-box-containing protein